MENLLNNYYLGKVAGIFKSSPLPILCSQILANKILSSGWKLEESFGYYTKPVKKKNPYIILHTQNLQSAI